jgi:hypothetical protein
MAKRMAPVTVMLIDPHVGFVEVAFPPIEPSKADVNPAAAMPLAPRYEIERPPELGMENVPLGGTVCPARYQSSALHSGVVTAFCVLFACVIVTPP